MEHLPSYKDDLYLAHHGIKGQKWGIRRYQNKDGTYTPAGKNHRMKDGSRKSISEQSLSFVKKHKKALAVGATTVASGLAIYGAYSLYKEAGYQPSGYRTYGLYEPLSDHINDYSSEGATIKAGSKLQRVSASAIEDFTNKGYTYCSYLFRDNQRYKSSFRGENSPNGSRDFVHTIKPKHELKIASPKTCATIFNALYPNARDDTFRYVCDPYAFTNHDDDDEDAAYYKVFEQKRAKLVGELTKRGYSGIVDMEDATKVKGSKPVIIFNPDDHVEVVKSRKIGTFETFVATKLK